MRWPFGPPHLTLKPSQQKNQTKKTKKQKQNKNKKTNKEGLGPSEVALRATSHDPSTLQKKHQKKQNQKKKTKKDKKREKNKKKQKILKNELFSYQWKFSSFLGGCPKFPFFDNLAQKARTQKTL